MRRQAGFTLIELLVTVAIIGALAAIAIPSMLNSIDKARQRQSMADMRTIATALEQYDVDNSLYPVQATEGAFAPTVSGYLTPIYAKVIPEKDGWQRDYQYVTSASGGEYTLRSLAKDGVKNGPLGPTSSFKDDIVLEIGQFVAWPSGAQNP